MTKFASAIGPVAIAILWTALVGCGSGADNGKAAAPKKQPGTHTHADGTVHSDDAHKPKATPPPAPDHGHEEIAIGTARVGAMDVELAQGHGTVKPGAESHLIVKLPYDDDGATIVRAWIGTEDPTAFVVGIGVYSVSDERYSVHTIAPAPLPADVKWWIEIQDPDGTRVVGSAPVIR